jgi:hypothetical protein
VNVPQYQESVQNAINEFEEVLIEALGQLKANLIDAKKATFGTAPYGAEHEAQRAQLPEASDRSGK